MGSGHCLLFVDSHFHFHRIFASFSCQTGTVLPPTTKFLLLLLLSSHYFIFSFSASKEGNPSGKLSTISNPVRSLNSIVYLLLLANYLIDYLNSKEKIMWWICLCIYFYRIDAFGICIAVIDGERERNC